MFAHLRFIGAAAIATLAAAAVPVLATAEDYPSRTVSLVVAFPAGGGVDTVGRVVAQKLTEALGQQVIVVNRPGAGSVIGTRVSVCRRGSLSRIRRTNVDVRFGSKADICDAQRHVRFTPKSGHVHWLMSAKCQ